MYVSQVIYSLINEFMIELSWDSIFFVNFRLIEIALSVN